MNVGGTQAELVTEGYEEVVVERYKKIKQIICDNCDLRFEDAIKKVANISVGSWYNYTSSGKQRGRVSKFTVENLSKFTGLNEDVFNGKGSFGTKEEDVIAQAVSTKLGNNTANNQICKNELSVIECLANILKDVESIHVTDIDDALQLTQVLRQKLDSRKSEIELLNRLQNKQK